MTAFSPYQAYPSPEPMPPVVPPPVLLAVADPAPQSRVTVAFRLILAVPHAFVLYILLLVARLIAFLGWWGALFTGRLPQFATDFLSGYLHWATRVGAYALLLTDSYPPFSFDDDLSYPVRIAIPERQRLNRAAVFFRFLLAWPASIVAATVIMGTVAGLVFVAWPAALISGRLPAPFRLAFSAVLRYNVRYYGYLWMLTPAYPSGLFGDAAGADQPSAPMPPIGFGTAAAPGYGAPGYGAPGAAPGYGYGVPGYGAPGAAPGYGVPGAVGGYGVPGYGYPAGYTLRPAFQPASWLLQLSVAAKRLIAAALVLGSLIWAGSLTYDAMLLSSLPARMKSQIDTQLAGNALSQVGNAHATLISGLRREQRAARACKENLSCRTAQDREAANSFNTFSRRLEGTMVPDGSLAAGTALNQQAVATAQVFTRLSMATTNAQYQATFTAVNLPQALTSFDADYSAFVKSLHRY